MSKVDILLATYNGEAFLSEQLDSLLSQTQRDIHIIIRDDGSTDGTRAIIKEYQQRYPQIEFVEGENAGPQGNFSKLMALSQSDYALFCDQDDVWKRDKVAKSLALMHRLESQFGKTTPLLVHTDLCVADKNLKELSPSFLAYANLNPKRESLNRLLVQNVVTGCTMLMNRSLLDLSQPIPKEALMHDWWVALVASAFGKIGFLPESTLYYRQHGKNQLGAIKYSPLTLIKKGLARLFSKKAENSNYRQAEAFLLRYKERLTARQREMLTAYLHLPATPFFTGRYRVIKYGFFRNGFLRNIGLLFR